MESVPVTVEEMNTRVVRFAQMTPRTVLDAAKTGLSEEIIDNLQADENYTYMAPVMNQNSIISAHAALASPDGAGDGLAISLAMARPGRGPEPHIHENTIENFFCIRGKFLVQWGNDCENSLELNEFDMVSVPPGVMRKFINLADEDSYLLALIQGDRSAFNDITYRPDLAERIAAQWGDDVVDTLVTHGRRFDAGVATTDATIAS